MHPTCIQASIVNLQWKGRCTGWSVQEFYLHFEVFGEACLGRLQHTSCTNKTAVSGNLRRQKGCIQKNAIE